MDLVVLFMAQIQPAFSVYYMDLVHMYLVIKYLLWMEHVFKHHAWSASAHFASLIIHKHALSYHNQKLKMPVQIWKRHGHIISGCKHSKA